MADDGGLAKFHKPGGNGDDEEENEFTSFLKDRPDSGQILEKIKATQEEVEANAKMKAENRYEDRFGFCCGIEW